MWRERSSEPGSSSPRISFEDSVQYTAKRTKQDSAKQTDDKTRRCEIDGRQDKTDETKRHRTETPDSDASNAPAAFALHLAQPQRFHKKALQENGDGRQAPF